MLPHPLTNFEIQKYQNEPGFNGIYSRINLPNIKNGTYLINLDEWKSIRTDWMALYVHSDNVTNFDSVGAEYIPKEIKKTHNQQKYYNKYLCNMSKWFNNVGILLYWIYWFYAKRKSLLGYTNLFSPSEYEKNDKIIPGIFSIT